MRCFQIRARFLVLIFYSLFQSLFFYFIVFISVHYYNFHLKLFLLATGWFCKRGLFVDDFWCLWGGIIPLSKCECDIRSSVSGWPIYRFLFLKLILSTLMWSYIHEEFFLHTIITCMQNFKTHITYVVSISICCYFGYVWNIQNIVIICFVLYIYN